MRYINRAFGFTEKADISFSDVNSSDVFYETVQIAVKQGYINGVGNNRMAPEGTLTREQAATILGRLHKYTPTADLSALDMFSDRAEAERLQQILRCGSGQAGLYQRLHERYL